MRKPTVPTVELAGVTYVIIPATLAAEHGIIGDKAAERRRALGRKLRRARTKADLSQAELAAKLGTSQPSISAVEGGREPCSEDRAAAWLAACGSTGGKAKA